MVSEWLFECDLSEEPAETMEGASYISAEIQMGQVYMKDGQDMEIHV